MLKLYQLPRACGIVNISPPCMKLETWLRIARLEYELRPLDLSKAPKGKVPYIEEGEDGVLMGDSTLIIKHLSRRHGIDLDHHLSPSQRAVSTAVRRMLKENFYWVIVYLRWQPDESWAIWQEHFLSMLPPSLRELPADQRTPILEGIRKNTLQQLAAQGMGRHSAEEVAEIGIEDLQVLADLLADKPYLMGDAISTVDATAYAHLASVLGVPVPSPVKDWASSQRNLNEYCQRMTSAYFPELQSAGHST